MNVFMYVYSFLDLSTKKDLKQWYPSCSECHIADTMVYKIPSDLLHYNWVVM